MAYAATAPRGLHIVARLNAAFAAVKAARKRRAAYEETVTELSALSNRELTDLGVDRHDIQRIAYEHVYTL
ncbi:DUF1127 domain-containing protein [Thalassovita mediterranea]|jgi:uncharacterized protein YjiS (DUF1127 family)|uniref:YjiS-like domain-containing protein n=1 Tax=Thalassovita mediterranea TaxID=340021 RepID=A0A0P1GPR7_9RHOB|nr:DUF1127 domain-containing protein [Thalassovita mediterranea]MCG7573893.1 DUF1127 domain-containing protein [Phaeobacter sp. CNT1-3]CUH84575.1 hypothetical protein TM5383_01786 [Thalassovita mediterranea]SIS32197.1 protein of unknown function [Thalassovita mediterranea]